jgi:AcrR family transcriptional regulator
VAKQSDAARSRRTRRTQSEVERLLLEAARERFTTHGYDKASLRSIAADAGASPQLIFNYYGSKAGLFEAAVLEPFGEFIEDTKEQIRRAPQAGVTTVHDLVRAYVRGLYRMFREHRTLVLALFTSDAVSDGDVGAKISNMFSELLEPFTDFGETGVSRALWKGQDVRLVTRATLVLISTMALIDSAPDESGSPAEEHVVDQLSHLLTYGYLGPR